MKVLAAYIHLTGKPLYALERLGYVNGRNQFRILCKCKSMAEANRKCAAAGLGDKLFISGQCADTGNEKELKVCTNTDIAINLGGISGDEYATIEQINEVLGGCL